MPPRVAADAEAVIAAYLRDHPDVAANHVGKRIPEDPDDLENNGANPAWPLIRVTRVGGTPAIQKPFVLDAPRIQVEVFGEIATKADAVEEVYDLAAIAHGALLEIPGAVLLGGVRATDAETTIGLTSSDDPDTGRARYLFEVQIWLRAAPAA